MASEDGLLGELRIMLVGDSGSGKSSSGNTILRKRAFPIRHPWVPRTLTSRREREEFEGTALVVVDIPSTFLINAIEMFRCISYCAPGPHAFLAVISLKEFTNVEQYVKTLQWLFGEEVLRYIIVLFTRGDELADEVTKEEFISQCTVPSGVGYHIFNNKSEDPSQVRELLEKINTMVQRNGGSYCIKVKDWKQKCLYLLASAVTIGGGIGAASGGTGLGVLVAVVGSVVGAGAAHVGGNRAVAVSIAGAAVVGLAVAIGAGVVTGAGITLKATAATATGAVADGAAFKGFAHMVHLLGLVGMFGGAAVGAGVPGAVGAYAARAVLDYGGAYMTTAVGVIAVVLALLLIIVLSDTPSSKVVGFTIVSVVSAGAAFGANVGILGASHFAAGVMIYVACQAVIWWLNRK